MSYYDKLILLSLASSMIITCILGAMTINYDKIQKVLITLIGVEAIGTVIYLFVFLISKIKG